MPRLVMDNPTGRLLAIPIEDDTALILLDGSGSRGAADYPPGAICLGIVEEQGTSEERDYVEASGRFLVLTVEEQRALASWLVARSRGL